MTEVTPLLIELQVGSVPVVMTVQPVLSVVEVSASLPTFDVVANVVGVDVVSAGAPGARGQAGSDGAPGRAGDAGRRGDQGLAGVDGLAGVGGEQGIQGVQGVAGPVSPAGLVWRSAWSPIVQYAKDDAVGYDNSSFFASSLPPLGAIPSNASLFWELLALQGATGTAGTDGLAGLEGAAGQTGSEGARGARGARGDTGAAAENAVTTEYVDALIIALEERMIAETDLNRINVAATAIHTQRIIAELILGATP